jgi:hypothetical protein
MGAQLSLCVAGLCREARRVSGRDGGGAVLGPESFDRAAFPKVGPQGGRRPFPIAVMLRIYCLQQWYNLSDPGAEAVADRLEARGALLRGGTVVDDPD